MIELLVGMIFFIQWKKGFMPVVFLAIVEKNNLT